MLLLLQTYSSGVFKEVVQRTQAASYMPQTCRWGCSCAAPDLQAVPSCQCLVILVFIGSSNKYIFKAAAIQFHTEEVDHTGLGRVIKVAALLCA